MGFKNHVKTKKLQTGAKVIKNLEKTPKKNYRRAHGASHQSLQTWGLQFFRGVGNFCPYSFVKSLNILNYVLLLS